MYRLFPTSGFPASPAARNEPPLGAAGARPQEPTVQGSRAPFPLPGSLATGPRVSPLGASETPASHSGVFGRFRVGPRGCPRHSQVWECLSPSSWRTRTILLPCASPKPPAPPPPPTLGCPLETPEPSFLCGLVLLQRDSETVFFSLLPRSQECELACGLSSECEMRKIFLVESRWGPLAAPGAGDGGPRVAHPEIWHAPGQSCACRLPPPAPPGSKAPLSPPAGTGGTRLLAHSRENRHPSALDVLWG